MAGARRDKKPADINFQEGRGKRIYAEVVLDRPPVNALDPALLAAALGVVAFGYALINLTAVDIRLPARAERRWGPAVGLLSGFITGANYRVDGGQVRAVI